MSLGPSAWADGKTVSSLGDPGRLVTSVFLVFSNTGAAHPLPQKLPCLQWSSVCFWVPLVSPRRMLLMNQGSQDPWGLAQGLLGTHCFPCGTQEHFTVVRCFFHIWCHKCPGTHLSNVTIPSGAFCLLWGTPSWPETHPGFELGNARFPGPTAGPDGKARSPWVTKKSSWLCFLFFLFHK